MPGSDSSRRYRLWLAGIVCLALLLRVLVIVNTRQMGVFADMQDYHDRAVHLLQTGTLWPDAFRVPLFPIFIAGIFKLFGQSLVAVRLAQAVLGAITTALTYVLAKRVTSTRGALGAAVVVAVYPALLLYSAYLMAETLFTFLAVLGLVLWVRRGWRSAVAAGLVIGAATLTRSTGLAIVVGIVLSEAWIALRRRDSLDRMTLLRIAAFGAAFAVVLVPWVQRNYAMYQRLIPTDTSSGFNALLGNYPGATGRHPGIPEVNLAAQEYWRTAPNDLARSDIGMRVARDFVREHPGRAVRLALLKIGYLFGVEGREHAWGYSFHLQGRRASSTVWSWGIAIIASFPVLMTLASIGFWRPGVSETRAAVVLLATLVSVIAIHVASFGDSRFHLPWIPLLAVFAARAFAPLTARPWNWQRQLILAMWLVCFALAWKDQSAELLTVLPRLAQSPVPLQLPY